MIAGQWSTYVLAVSDTIKVSAVMTLQRLAWVPKIPAALYQSAGDWSSTTYLAVLFSLTRLDLVLVCLSVLQSYFSFQRSRPQSF